MYVLIVCMVLVEGDWTLTRTRGPQIPTISNCRPYAFDTIYETESTNSVGLWSVPYKTWMDYVDRKQRRSPLAAR